MADPRKKSYERLLDWDVGGRVSRTHERETFPVERSEHLMYCSYLLAILGTDHLWVLPDAKGASGRDMSAIMSPLCAQTRVASPRVNVQLRPRTTVVVI